MGADLVKTEMTVKLDYKISPQTNNSCLPFLPEKTQTKPKHKNKHSLLVLQTREDYYSTTLKIKRQNTSGSNHGENKRPYRNHKKHHEEERCVKLPSPHATKPLFNAPSL